jgi:hypothetical protein
LALAGFRDVKRLEDFDFSFNPTIKKNRIDDLATCQFMRDRRDVLWLEPPGTGKSHLAQALGYAAIRSGFTVYYPVIDKPGSNGAFDFVDPVLGCRHLLSHDPEGIEIQTYCAIIACMFDQLVDGPQTNLANLRDDLLLFLRHGRRKRVDAAH